MPTHPEKVDPKKLTTDEIHLALKDIGENSRTEELAASLFYDIFGGLNKKTKEIIKEQLY